MSESSDRNPQKGKIIKSSISEDSDKITLSSESRSDLAAIKNNLSERIQSAQTPQEIRELLKLREEVQSLSERQIQQEYAEIQVEEFKNQSKFERKREVTKEVSTIVASIASVGIGLYLTASSPLLGPLLIIIGLVKPLEYSLSEVSDLIKSFSDYTTKLPKLFSQNKDIVGK